MKLRKVVKAFIPRKLFRKIEPVGHLGESALFNAVNGFPAKQFKIIGITGTNGKTTTAFLVHRMLHEAGYKVGLMTTVAYGAGMELKMPADHYTNVPVPLMMQRLRYLQAKGVEYLVMEVTSMALAQNRLWGVPFYLAGMTNISQDHLDYHGTMDRYIDAKVKLFRLVNHNKNGIRTGVVNADDPAADRFAGVVKNAVSYGIKKGDIKAQDIKLKASGLSYRAVAGKEVYSIKSSLPGRFNVYNTLAAVGVGRALDLSKRQIEQGIAALDGVPGRMTAVEAGQKFNVLVDFAHTPDALENVLKAARDLTKGKLMLVFGATGDRDRSKRPLMGRAAADNADALYLTDDETYTESPGKIIQDVFKGIEEAGGAARTIIVEDRRKAIKAAFAAAKRGDTVLLTGIGHQVSRNMGGQEEPWNELEIAKKLLKNR